MRAELDPPGALAWLPAEDDGAVEADAAGELVALVVELLAAEVAFSVDEWLELEPQAASASEAHSAATAAPVPRRVRGVSGSPSL
ncbi:MAG TPA: hypothetical protein VKV27_11830 [Solirubrobacteraceae bacterium]|nr:hypothetical protein [Solirubrobacteraceae bacterium]